MELTTDVNRIRATVEAEAARKALELSKSGTDYAGYCGLLEYHMGRLLALIDDLTQE